MYRSGAEYKSNNKITQCLAVAAFLVLISMVVFAEVIHAETIKLGIHEVKPVAIVAEWPINNHTQVGEHFSARVVEDIVTDTGEIFIPKNSRVVGRVHSVKDSKFFNRSGKVDIKFEKIVYPDHIHSLAIQADGLLIPEKYKAAKVIGGAVKETLFGAAIGAAKGFKFAGIVGAGSSTGSNVAIGAAAGAGLSLISFISKRGSDVKIYPGLPMTLNIEQLEKSKFKEQHLAAVTTGVKADIKKFKKNKVKLEIANDTKDAIPLANLKIVDALGYTTHPVQGFKYFDQKVIPANSKAEYEFTFPEQASKTRQWLVLTDSFNKQEFFKVELN